ncbi:RagB/SusD family nutrient uptake outer membrane protein [Ferruginibacter sp.]|nr:RagB/SusD family nutrient uptake outer membrane protein [Ferruginibacter sp.]
MQWRSFNKTAVICFTAGLMLTAISSCKKLTDVEPKTTVGVANMYRNVFDADAAVIGVYGKVMKLAKPYLLMNELRGDLMDITTNSDANLRQISEHTATVSNPYIDPQPFYEVIVNCNDVLANFKTMFAQSKLKEAEFNQRYSDVAAVRTWVYLQLGIHFGKIPYVTNPVVQVNDLKDSANFPMLTLPVLIDSLTSFMEKLPFTEDYPAGTTLQTTVDGYSTNKFFINKNSLLGDLYLWQGQYDKAADKFKKVMEPNGSVGSSTAFYNQYKVSNGTINPALNSISYSRAFDITSLNYDGSSWRNLFERPQVDNEFFWEWIWSLPFDKNFEPVNPFIDMFSPNGGSYLLQPSQQAMDNWNSQTQVYGFASGTATVPTVYRNNFPLDSRGTFTYKMIGGKPVIMKYLYNYLDGSTNQPINVFSKPGKWFLNRATAVHLHYSEAANRAGKMKVAYALTNYGIRYTYDTLAGLGGTRNVTDFQQTFLPWPYDFDARQGDAPSYRNPWYRNMGIRGRANLKLVPIDSVKYFDMTPVPGKPNSIKPLIDSLGYQKFIEDMIITEDALELAYEGQRWSDLLRIAIRRNDPAFIADKVYDKLRKSGLSAGAANAARAKLMSKDWFLPFKFK